MLLTYLDTGYSLSLVLGNQYHMLRKIASYLFCSKVVSMAEPNESNMKYAIQVVSECYSIHRLDSLLGSSDCI